MFTDRNDPTEFDPFNSIDTVNARGGRNPYLLQGNYHLRIEQCKSFQARDKRLFYLVEMTILSSDNPDRPEGMLISWMTNLGKEMGAINVKRFLAAANGIDPDDERANVEITKDVARYSVSDAQPLQNQELFATCVDVITKEGSDFLDVKFMPIAVTA